MTLTVTVQSAEFSALLGRLSQSARTSLAKTGLYAMEVGVRSHLSAAAATRHSTASKLGAAPTGHLEKAAQSVRSEADGAGGAVVVESPGIGRALGPVRIVPRLARALTIPKHPLAYGRRAKEVERLIGSRLFRPTKAGGAKSNVLAGTINGEMVVLYSLTKAVTLRHDPGLLPTVPEISAMAKGAMLRRVAQVAGGVA